MKSLRIHAIAAAAALLSLTPLAAQVESYKDIKTPPLHQFKIEQPKRIALPNGMVIFLMEDHELPLIHGYARIRGGSRDIPADKAGLMAIYSESWRTGGTEAKSGDQLDDFLAARAAKVESGGGEDSTTLNLDVLKGDFDTVLPIFVDLLRHPAFRQEKIDLAKTHVNTAISRRNDDPSGILQREAAKLAYGVDSPYTRQAEYATVASITRADLLAFHDRFVHPNNIIFGLAGDFDSAAMEKKLRAAFESWPKGEAASHTAPAAGQPAKPGVYFIAKDDVTQSNIAVVGPGGILRSNPDFYSVAVLNEIYSGGFSGRLMNHIRTAMGLAYGVGGSLGAGWDVPGIFRTSMGTKSGSTVQAVQALRNEISDLATKPITADEVNAAKETILNAFVFMMDSKSKVLNQRMNLEFYGYPSDYYQNYVANIEKVTPADVERVAKKYIAPANYAVLVVGKEKDFDQPLATLGGVTPIDVTIAEAGETAGAKKATASTPEGLALVKKVLQFTGGAAKVDAVKSLHSAGTLQTKTPAGAMELELDNLVQYPDSRRSTVKTPMGEMTSVTTPNAAFMVTPMGVQDLPPSQLASIRGEGRSDVLTVLKNIDNPKYVFTTGTPVKIGAVEAQLLDINADGTHIKWYVDPASGKVLRRVSPARQGGEATTDFTEWKTVDGITLPAAFTITQGGDIAGSGKMTTIEVNAPVDPKAFEKPAK